MNKPYVYIIQNKDRTHWYVGVKLKPKTGEDYWGSSPYLKKLMEESGKENWEKTIISEFDDKDIAHEFEQMLIELMWDLPGRVNKNINGYVDHSDPEVKANHRAGIEKMKQDPVWQANNRAGKEKMKQNPEYQANYRAGREKMKQNPVYRANHKAAMQKRAKPFIATSIATGEEFYCESTRCDQVKALELHKSTVSECLNGKHKQHKGFTFRYI